MNAKLNENTTASIPSLRYLVDENGNHWFCDAEAEKSKPLAGQACIPAEDWIYDRNFGG